MSPAFAASMAVAARAFGPSSATSVDKVCGPRELLITTLYPCAIASRAIWLPMCPAPISPMVLITVPMVCDHDPEERGGLRKCLSASRCLAAVVPSSLPEVSAYGNQSQGRRRAWPRGLHVGMGDLAERATICLVAAAVRGSPRSRSETDSVVTGHAACSSGTRLLPGTAYDPLADGAALRRSTSWACGRDR